MLINKLFFCLRHQHLERKSIMFAETENRVICQKLIMFAKFAESQNRIMCEAGQGKERLQWQDGVGNIQVRNIQGLEIFLGGKYGKYLKVGNIRRWEACVVGIYSGVGNNQEWAWVQGVDSRKKKK